MLRLSANTNQIHLKAKHVRLDKPGLKHLVQMKEVLFRFIVIFLAKQIANFCLFTQSINKWRRNVQANNPSIWREYWNSHLYARTCDGSIKLYWISTLVKSLCQILYCPWRCSTINSGSGLRSSANLMNRLGDDELIRLAIAYPGTAVAKFSIDTLGRRKVRLQSLSQEVADFHLLKIRFEQTETLEHLDCQDQQQKLHLLPLCVKVE